MNSLDHQIPRDGFVRRLASSFSSKINSNDKDKPKLNRNSLDRNSFTSGMVANKIKINELNSNGKKNSVADIKRNIEKLNNNNNNNNNNNMVTKNRLFIENGVKKSPSFVNKFTSSLKKSIKHNEPVVDRNPKETHRSQYQVEETLNGIQIQIKQPHLISVIRNTNEAHLKSNKTSIRIYPLKLGKTMIGSGLTNDIILEGVGIQPEHCIIESKLITIEKEPFRRNKLKELTQINSVMLVPIAELCAVEGVIIDEPYKITSGSMICLGESDYFRYNYPNEDISDNDEDTTELEDIIISNSEVSELEKSSNSSLSTSSYKSSTSSTNDKNIEDKFEISKKESKSEEELYENRKIQPAIKKIANKDGQNELPLLKDKTFKRTVRFNLPNSNEEEAADKPKDSNLVIKDSDFLVDQNFPSKNISEYNSSPVNKPYAESKENKKIVESTNDTRDLNRIALAKLIFSKSETSKESLNSEKDSKRISNKAKNSRPPSETFLSKIIKFEQLSKGIKPSDNSDELEQDTKSLENIVKNNNIDKSDIESNTDSNTKESLNRNSIEMNDLEMRITRPIKYQNRDIKSKSFGCEKDLHNSINDNKRGWSNNRDSVKSKAYKNRRSKKPKNIIESVEAAKAAKRAMNSINKPCFMDNINFIDDDDSSLTENHVNTNKRFLVDDSDEDLYNENAFIGDIGDSDENDALIDDFNVTKDNEDNDTNPEESDDDEDDENSSTFSSDFNQDLKCRSAPITPTRMSPTMHMTQNNDYQYNDTCNSTKNGPSSFVYNMNLYDDPNFKILNDKENFERECNRLNRQKARSKNRQGFNFDSDNENGFVNLSSLSSSDSSISSLNCYNLEPLVIEEDTDRTKNITKQESNIKSNEMCDIETCNEFIHNTRFVDRIIEETPEDMLELEKDDLNAEITNDHNNFKNPQSSASSSSTSLQVTSLSDQAESEDLRLKEENEEKKSDIIDATEIDDSFTDIEEMPRSESIKESATIEKNIPETVPILTVDTAMEKKKSDNYDDASQISHGSTVTITESLLSPSQIHLKDNYEKAKRERQYEQEQAELEKIRLQEILDICMEFQRQEENKSPSKRDLTPTLNLNNTKLESENGKLKHLTDVIRQRQSELDSNQNIMKTSSSVSSALSTSTTSSTSAAITNSLQVNTKQSNNKNTQDCKVFNAKPQENTAVSQKSPDNSSNEEISNLSSSSSFNIAQHQISAEDLLKPSNKKQLTCNEYGNSDDLLLNKNYEVSETANIQSNTQNRYSNQTDQDNHHIPTNLNIFTSEAVATGTTKTQPQRLVAKAQVEQLSREKCEVITSLNYFKQKIQDIEMRQNQAIRDLEMERALLDVEHNNQFKNIQNDEAKLKHLQQEHQLRIEAFNLHTSQIRNEIEMVQMTMKNVENEILILDTNLDTNFMESSLSYNEQKHLDSLKHQKQHALEESKRIHEDLEFQLMELEAKYESELEDIQNRLIKEQDNLLNAFKKRQANLNEYDQQQTDMLMAVKAETEYLEVERQKLIEQFKKQRTHLHQIEKKLNKLQEQEGSGLHNQNQNQQSPVSDNNQPTESSSSNKNTNSSQSPQEESPSPASSSVSLSSVTTSTANTPPPANGQINTNSNQSSRLDSNNTTSAKNPVNHQLPHYNHNPGVTLTPNRYIPPSHQQHRFIAQNNLYLNQQQAVNFNQMQQFQNQMNPQNNLKGYNNPQYNKQLSQSFRDILENTLLINGFNDINVNEDTNNYQNHIYQMNRTQNGTLPRNLNKNLNSSNQNNQSYQRYGKYMTNSTNSLNSNLIVNSMTINAKPQYFDNSLDNQQYIVLNDTLGSDGQSDKSSGHSDKNLKNSTDLTVNNQIAMKFAELERTLAKTKAENNNLLEQQLMARERELQLLQQEKQKRDELEKQLNDEIQMREKIVEENIQLRHKKPTQARPLTRYLPVRDNNFDLKQHVENSGHQIMNQFDPHTKQPLLQINEHSCRGYLLKMGQKFKTWNKRWFVFDRQKRTLCYYLDRHETKLRGSIYFQSIKEVFVDHMRTIKSPDSKSTFVVKTFDRNFHLVAPSSELMRMWVEVIITGAEGYLEYND